MNKSELIDSLATRFEGNRKAAAHALESVVDTITREVARGEKVAITGFGSFEKRVRDARWVRNPATGERIQAQATAIARFKPGAELMGVVSGARKLPETAIAAAADLLPDAIADKIPATKASAKKAAAKQKAAAKKSAADTGAATKSAAKKGAAKKPATKKAAAKKLASSETSAPTKKAAAKKLASKSTAKKTTAKKTTAKKSAAKKAASSATSAPASKSAAKIAARAASTS